MPDWLSAQFANPRLGPFARCVLSQWPTPGSGPSKLRRRGTAQRTEWKALSAACARPLPPSASQAARVVL
eukprot:12588935-Alexandrium_andersonii.AAC.1